MSSTPPNSTPPGSSLPAPRRGSCGARRAGVVLGALATLAVPCLPAGADDVHLENGRVFEDVIATVTDTHVVIEMAYGRMRLPRAQVARVEERTTPLETYRERRSELVGDPTSAASAWADLARWAWAHGLDRDATETALLAVRLDSSVEGLEGMLTQRGFERDPELGWLPRAVAMERRGLVFYGGDWVTPERRAELVAHERAERERVARVQRETAETEAERRDEPEGGTADGPTAEDVAMASIQLARDLVDGNVGITLGRTSSLSLLHPVFMPYLPLSGGGGFWTGGGGGVASAAPRTSGSADWEALSARIPGSRLPLGSFRRSPR